MILHSPCSEFLDDTFDEIPILTLQSPAMYTHTPVPQSTSPSVNHTQKKHRNVRFGVIDIRYYESCLGDHPCVSSGVPVSITDVWVQGEHMGLSEYERKKDENGGRSQCSRLSAEARWERCREFGVDEQTLCEVASLHHISPLLVTVSATAPTLFPRTRCAYDASQCSPKASTVFTPTISSSITQQHYTWEEEETKQHLCVNQQPFSAIPPMVTTPPPVMVSATSMPELWLWA